MICYMIWRNIVTFVEPTQHILILYVFKLHLLPPPLFYSACLSLLFVLNLSQPGQLRNVFPTASNSIISLRSINFQSHLCSLLCGHDALRYRVWLVRTFALNFLMRVVSINCYAVTVKKIDGLLPRAWK